MTVIKVVCAWCGNPMGEKDGQGREGVSHGMCKECVAKWEKDATEPCPAKRRSWRSWLPSKGKRKLWLYLFWMPTLLTGVTIAGFILTKSPWYTIVALFTAWSWYLHYQKYRELMNNPMMYPWMLQQEFGGKPQAKEGCKLWVGNKGICKPLTEDRCQSCDGYQKKRRWV